MVTLQVKSRKRYCNLRDHLRVLYAADTSLHAFHHAQIGTGTVPFERIATMLRGATLCPPTILEIVADNAQLAIDTSVEQLDSIRRPTG